MPPGLELQRGSSRPEVISTKVLFGRNRAMRLRVNAFRLDGKTGRAVDELQLDVLLFSRRLAPERRQHQDTRQNNDTKSPWQRNLRNTKLIKHGLPVTTVKRGDASLSAP